MRRLFFLIVLVFLVSNNSYAVSYNSDPKIFITELVDDAIKTLNVICFDSILSCAYAADGLNSKMETISTDLKNDLDFHGESKRWKIRKNGFGKGSIWKLWEVPKLNYCKIVAQIVYSGIFTSLFQDIYRKKRQVVDESGRVYSLG